MWRHSYTYWFVSPVTCCSHSHWRCWPPEFWITVRRAAICVGLTTGARSCESACQRSFGGIEEWSCNFCECVFALRQYELYGLRLIFWCVRVRPSGWTNLIWMYLTSLQPHILNFCTRNDFFIAWKGLPPRLLRLQATWLWQICRPWRIQTSASSGTEPLTFWDEFFVHPDVPRWCCSPCSPCPSHWSFGDATAFEEVGLCRDLANSKRQLFQVQSLKNAIIWARQKKGNKMNQARLKKHELASDEQAPNASSLWDDLNCRSEGGQMSDASFGPPKDRESESDFLRQIDARTRKTEATIAPHFFLFPKVWSQDYRSSVERVCFPKTEVS